MSTTTPRALAAKALQLVATLDRVLKEKLRTAADLTNRAALANLSGARSAAPWSYPVPVRTRGTGLRANQRWQSPSPTVAYVFNSATYAAAVHDGIVSEWAGRGKHRIRVKAAPRPFEDDAVRSVQPDMVIVRGIQEAVATWA